MSAYGGQILIHRISDTFYSSNLKHKIEVVTLLKVRYPTTLIGWISGLKNIFSRVFTLNVTL